MAGQSLGSLEMLRQWLLHPLASWHAVKQREATESLHYLQSRYHTFRALLEDNNRAVFLLTDLGMKLRNSSIDLNTREICEELLQVTGEMVDKLGQLSGGQEGRVSGLHDRISTQIQSVLAETPGISPLAPVLSLDAVSDDMHGLVGGKASILAKLRKIGTYRVPAGFVIPLSSCRLFLEQDNLNLRLTTQLHPYLHSETADIPKDIEEKVKQRVMETPLPTVLQTALTTAASQFLPGKGTAGLAVRSSAVGEDGYRLSFAGQYKSVLNVVTLADLEAAFKEVIASSFSNRNISYRLHAGLDPMGFDLAVLCLGMVPAKSAGTLFTVDPNRPASGQMLVSAVYGLGELAVAGSMVSDIFRPQRKTGIDPKPFIARKEYRLVCHPAGGVQQEEVAPEDQEKPALQPSQLARLCQWGLAVEKMESCPQDIEWAIDENDEPVLLQARPFRLARQSEAVGAFSGEDRVLLLSGGVTASSGEGTGRVWIVRGRADLNKPPEEPYVLVMPQSLVDAVPALQNARGVLVDLGNPLDHLSCVAREYEIPMITGLNNAVNRLAEHEWVLVDADSGRVWQPLEKDIQKSFALVESMQKKGNLPEIPADSAAAGLYRLTVPLNLTDAYGPTFSIAECRTLHDIIRYVHEKAVIAMFAMGDQVMEKSSHIVHHLESEVPFFISIIDLGGGLVERAGLGRWITIEDIVSSPLKALWQGVSDPEVNWGPPAGGAPIGSVMSRFLSDHKSDRPIGLPNYAIITRDYLNLNARMDFHFIMVDTVSGIDSRSNYIRFRFKGGGTTLQQRQRRAESIFQILEASGFACDVRDDLVTADLIGAPQIIIEEKLAVLGRLLGFTRLLDAAMRTDTVPRLAAEAFLAGNYQMSADLMTSDKGEESKSAGF
jgi:pyruvate,water dikinase